MDDEVLPASLEKLEIDYISHIPSSNSSINVNNPFRRGNGRMNIDKRYSLKRRNGSYSTLQTYSLCMIKNTMNLKSLHSERLYKPKHSLVKEAILCINNKGPKVFNEVTPKSKFKNASSSHFDIINRNVITKAFKATNLNQKLSFGHQNSLNAKASSFNLQRNSMVNMTLKQETSKTMKEKVDLCEVSETGKIVYSSACSLQARMSSPVCDVTIDELACYFEEFVHIPKKMSRMAEMMYI